MIRNTIILNDKSSADIAGLIIQELPPITKPAQRTETEIIDGRDGDITTPLGFAAYDKEFTIGLYGDFDINAIIAFFNSEGTVVFSNEPDKYYNYQINDQIDFERLVRFRTAKVKMHCQPFKYSTTEGAETLDPPAENLLSIPDFTKTTNGVTLTVSGGTISVSGTPSAATEFYVPTGGLNIPAGSFTLTAEATGTRVAAASIRLIGSVPSDADSFGGNYLGLRNAQPVAISDTLSASKTFQYLWFYITAGGAVDFNMTAEVQNNAEKVVSGEGTFLTLENSAEAPFNELTLKGDTEQDGTPTPDSPVEIKVVTGEQIVKVTGKNLLSNVLQSTISYSGTTSKIEGATWTVTKSGNGGISLNPRTDYLPINIPAGETVSFASYPISGTVSDASLFYQIRCYFYDKNKNLLGNIQTATTSQDIMAQVWSAQYTPSSDVAFIRLGEYIPSDTGTTERVELYLQLEKGSTATDYELPQEQNYPLTLGNLELVKIGDYQDYLWTDGEKWYKHAEVGKLIEDGTTATGPQDGVFKVEPSDVKGTDVSGDMLVMSDHYTAQGSRSRGSITDFHIAKVLNYQGAWNAQIGIKDSRFTTLADFKTWLSANNIVVYYVLKESIDEEITDETLISQLNALNGATAYRGRTHIISTAGSANNLPHIVAAEVMKISDGTITNAGNIYSKPRLTIYGSGDITINLNGIQLFQIALGDTEYITIDTAAMEAYKDSPGNLQNRLVTGAYENFALQPGENQITFSGIVTKCVVENYSRWL